MRLTSLLMAAAFVATSGVALADAMSSPSPKPTGAMKSSMHNSSMHSSSMKGSHMKGSPKPADHMMGSPKPKSTMKP